MTKVSARILFLHIISESCSTEVRLLSHSCLHAKAKAKLIIFVVLSVPLIRKKKKKTSIFSVSSLKLYFIFFSLPDV